MWVVGKMPWKNPMAAELGLWGRLDCTPQEQKECSASRENISGQGWQAGKQALENKTVSRLVGAWVECWVTGQDWQTEWEWKTSIRTDQRPIPKATVRNSHLILYLSLRFGERASFSWFDGIYGGKEAMPHCLFTVRMHSAWPYSLNNWLSPEFKERTKGKEPD